MSATVLAPADSGRAPYLTTEALGEIRAASDRLNALLAQGTGVAPGAAIGEAGTPAAGAAQAGRTEPAATVPTPEQIAAAEAVLRARDGGAPAPAPTAAPVAQESTAAAAERYLRENGVRLPASVQAGFRSMEDWIAVQAQMRQVRENERATSPSLRLQEAQEIREGRMILQSLLTESGFQLPNGRRIRVSEAIGTPEFPSLLRSGLRTILFSAYAMQKPVWPQLAYRAESNNQAEVWLEMSRLGLLPTVGELEEYPEVQTTQLPARRVTNSKYGAIIRISEEMVLFDKTNQILQIPRDRGEAAAQTLEDAAFTEIRTTGRYDKTSADNNIGNNTGTVTFSPAGVLGAWETLTTMRDPRALRYLGVMPDTLICGSGVYMNAVQLFRSRNIQSGEDGVTPLSGVGETNPFFGLVKNIIQSPYMGRYNWILCNAGKGFVYQEVDPLTLTDRTAATDDQHFRRDAYEYKVRLWFGFGLFDSRGWYYSDSTTAPTWA